MFFLGAQHNIDGVEVLIKIQPSSFNSNQSFNESHLTIGEYNCVSSDAIDRQQPYFESTSFDIMCLDSGECVIHMKSLTCVCSSDSTQLTSVVVYASRNDSFFQHEVTIMQNVPNLVQERHVDCAVESTDDFISNENNIFVEVIITKPEQLFVHESAILWDDYCAIDLYTDIIETNGLQSSQKIHAYRQYGDISYDEDIDIKSIDLKSEEQIQSKQMQETCIDATFSFTPCIQRCSAETICFPTHCLEMTNYSFVENKLDMQTGIANEFEYAKRLTDVIRIVCLDVYTAVSMETMSTFKRTCDRITDNLEVSGRTRLTMTMQQDDLNSVLIEIEAKCMSPRMRTSATIAKRTVSSALYLKLLPEYLTCGGSNEEAPQFLQHLTNKEAIIGESMQLRCIVSGCPLPTVVWYHEGNVISQSRLATTCYLIKTLHGDYIES